MASTSVKTFVALHCALKTDILTNVKREGTFELALERLTLIVATLHPLVQIRVSSVIFFRGKMTYKCYSKDYHLWGIWKYAPFPEKSPLRSHFRPILTKKLVLIGKPGRL